MYSVPVCSVCVVSISERVYYMYGVYVMEVSYVRRGVWHVCGVCVCACMCMCVVYM